MNLGEGATLLAIARNAEEGADEDLEEVGGVEESES
jgi:DNA gyrase subunit A